MKNINGVEFVNSLAEVTRNSDKDVIERSLLQSLLDFTTSSELRLYRVLGSESNKGLALMAYAKNNVIDTLDVEIKDTQLPEEFKQIINKTLSTSSTQILYSPGNDGMYHIIYPALDNSDSEIFAILIQSSVELDFDNQRMIHGFLKVYSNYLELIDKTRRDKLTQLLNRETLDAEITRILIRNNTAESNILKLPDYAENDQRYTVKNSTYWLGVVDIDFFKKINDNYGHLYGDEILILVSRLLEKNIRDYDSAFRFGGEEFVIIIATDDKHRAEYTFERIRLEINNHPYADIDNLSVSIGFTQITDQINPSDVIEQADSALYYAKRNGRNQAHLYEKLVEEGHIKKYSEDDIKDGGIDFF